MGAGVDAKCGISELMVFVAALVAGTGCSLTSKIMLDMKATGMDGDEEKFQVLRLCGVASEKLCFLQYSPICDFINI